MGGGVGEGTGKKRGERGERGGGMGGREKEGWERERVKKVEREGEEN